MAENDNAVDCAKNANLTLDQLWKAAITKDATGKKAIRVMYVAACEIDGVSCDDNHIPAEQQMRQCFGINECGKVALRLAPPAAYL